MTYQSLLSMEFPRQEYWNELPFPQARILEWITISFSRGFPQIRDQTNSSWIGKWILYHWAMGEVFMCHSVQLSSVAQSCPTLCHPMDCITLGFPAHHQHPENAQTHVHQIGDASNYLSFCRPLQSFPASGHFPMSQTLMFILDRDIRRDNWGLKVKKV